MPELETMSKPKTAGFVDSNYTNANKRRIEEEQAELDELTATEEQTEVAVEEPVEPEAKVNAEENLTPEEKTYKKRHTDARKYINEQDARIKALEERLNNPQDPSNVRLPKSDEDINQWAAKYPDVAAIVETIAEKKAQEKFNQADERFQRIDEINEAAERVEHENIIRNSHADFDDLKASDDFHNWAEKQPKWVSDALYVNTNSPEGVVRVIDFYKLENGMDIKSKKSSNKKAASAVMPKRNSANPEQDASISKFTESMVKKMSIADYEKNEAAIDQASRENPNFYDISGGAR